MTNMSARLEKLASIVRCLPPERIDAVAQAWRDLPYAAREGARGAVRRGISGGEWDRSWAATVEIRQIAATVAKLASVYDWAFSFAAWDAALAVVAQGKVDEKHLHILLSPMAPEIRQLPQA